MNKIVVAMMFCIVFCTGCLEKKPLIDCEKVGQTALEYMNSKYNQDFELLSCKPSKDFGIKNQASYAKAEVSLNDDTYYVNLWLDKSDWKVYWDDYMNTIAISFFKSNMDDILYKEIDIKEFTSNIGTYSGGFADNFPVITEKDTLKEIASSYAIGLRYWIDMPESSHYEGVDEDIKNALDPYFPHGIVQINIDVYSDDVYSSVKEKSATFYDKEALFSYQISIDCFK